MRNPQDNRGWPFGENLESGNAHSTIRHDVDIAGIRLRIHFPNEALAEFFMPAFACRDADANHQAIGPEWHLDVASGDTGVPRPPMISEDDAGSEMRLRADEEGYVLWMGRHAPTLYAVDMKARRALYWTASAASVPAWERSRPFLPILQVMLDPTPWIAVHSAALAHEGRTVMFTGPGRAGKTSLALAGLRAGWRFVGDDYILLRTDAAPAVAPLYATARLRDDMVGRFDTLVTARREISDEEGDRRHEIELARLGGTVDIGGGPLASILSLARRGAAEPTFGPTGRAALLSTLVANMTVATPGYGPLRVAKLFGLLSRFTPLSFDPGSAFGPALSALAGRLR